MREETITPDRLIAFSDGVFAVIVTVMVLELKVPDRPAFLALSPLWPTAIIYAVSYLFVAIIWINHHHLMRFVGRMGCAHAARLLSCLMQDCLYVSTLPTTSSKTEYGPVWTPRKCPPVCGAWRGADLYLCWQASRPLCWLSSSHHVPASV